MDPQSTAVVTPGASEQASATDGGAAAPETGAGQGIVERANRRPEAPADGTATATGATATPAPAATPDYKAQYEGLQGVYRQERTQTQARIAEVEQARQAAEARAQRAETAAWEGHWRLQGYSPEQIREAKTGLAAQQQLAAAQAKVKADQLALQNERAQFRAQTEPTAKQIVAERIAREEGVKVEQIIGFSHPDLMREFARALKASNRVSNLDSRRKAGTDRAESGGGGGLDVSKMSAHERIKAGLKQLHSQRR